MLAALSVIVGGLITIVTAILVENLRRPRLALQIIVPIDISYQNRPAKRAKYLLIGIENKNLNRFARWMSRNAALQCHGTITFHHLDGQNIFGRAMDIRWGNAPEPVPIQVTLDGHTFGFFDLQRFQMSQRIDLYPGEQDYLSLVARFDDEVDCYGWSNESYFSEHPWRNEKWRLKGERCLIKVSVHSAGEHLSEVFRLVNDVSIDDYRLEVATDEDKRKVRN